MMRNMNLFFLFSVLISVTGAFILPSCSSSSRRVSGSAVWGVPASRDALVMMPAILEKEQVGTGGPAVLDRPEVQRKSKSDSPVKERSLVGGETWEVRIYNDEVNTREHVSLSLVQVTGLSELMAYQTMTKSHQNGMAVVGRFVFEIAEMYKEGLRQNGIASDIVQVDEEN
jgi:ATP-dependent Clp protease adapter protein ClpS